MAHRLVKVRAGVHTLLDVADVMPAITQAPPSMKVASDRRSRPGTRNSGPC